MKMIDHNHFICHLILGTFTEYPFLRNSGFFVSMLFWIDSILLNDTFVQHDVRD